MGNLNRAQDFTGLVDIFIGFISLIIPLLFAVTFLYIAWGIINAWIIHSDDPTSIEKGKQLAITGVIALVIMSGIWGILKILQNSLF